MGLTLTQVTEKVRRRLTDEGRRLSDTIDLDVEAAIPTALEHVSRKVMDSSLRPTLETTVNVTLSAVANELQSGALATILMESVRDGDVTHPDLPKPLAKKNSILELRYHYSGSIMGLFAIADGKLYTRKIGTALTVGTPAVVRGIKLMLVLADLPANGELDGVIVDAAVEMLMGQPG